MGRDFRSELVDERCWDRRTQQVFERRGEALEDVVLQNREELIGLCEFIEEKAIRSYLEIGAWTGRLATVLHRLFQFDRVAVCDDGYAATFGLPIHLPPGALFLEGKSESEDFRQWRAGLGPIDLVLIDANHAYHAVKRDFETNRRFPHRYIALHDIVGGNRFTAGVKKFWAEINSGEKIEIVRPHLELELDHSLMGIGIWRDIPSKDVWR